MNFVQKTLHKDDKLLQHSLIILIGSALTSMINYLYQLLMGRMLGPAEYGVLGALFAIIAIVTYSFGTIKTVIMRFTATYFAKKELGKIRYLLTRATVRLSSVGLLGFVIFLGLSYVLSPLLNIPYHLFIWTGLFLVCSLLTPVPNGIINGMQKFYELSLLSFAGALFKLAIGIGLVSIGFGTLGAMLGLTLSQVLILVISFLMVAYLFKVKEEKVASLAIFSYLLPVFIGLSIMHLAVNLDTLFVKYFFSSVEAGYYVAASTMAKAILFASGAILMVMFPKVSLHHDNKLETSGILKSTLLYTALISFGAVVLYFMIPTFLSNLFFGKEYHIAALLGLFGLAIAFFSIANVLVMYNLAINSTRFIIGMLPLLALEIIGFVLFHANLKEMVQVVLVVNLLMMLYMLLVTRKALGVGDLL